MSKKSSRSNGGSSGQFKSVWIDFSHNERNEIVQYLGQRDVDLSALLEQWTTDGWKVSVSFSGAWGTFVCSATPKDVPGYRGSTVYSFKHTDFNRLCGILDFFFSVMVSNNDIRLDQGDDSVSW